jgi:hypothetical protein
MLLKAFFVISLLMFICDSVASECRCKQPQDNLFNTAKCPAKTVSNPVAPAIMPALRYASISIDDFMSLLGKLAGISVCLENETRGQIEFSSTRLEPWPVIVNSVANQYGLSVGLAEKSVVLYGRLQ